MRAQDHARERLPSLSQLIRLRSMPIENRLASPTMATRPVQVC